MRCVSPGRGRDYAARVPRRKAKKEQGNERREEGDVKKGENKVKGLNRRTGVRDRCFTCNSEYHLAPNCPSRGDSVKGSGPPLPVMSKHLLPPYLSISMESPVSRRGDASSVKKWSRRAIANNFCPPRRIWRGGPFERVRTVRLSWILAPRPI